jgi:hypothetical protein
MLTVLIPHVNPWAGDIVVCNSFKLGSQKELRDSKTSVVFHFTLSEI